MKIDDETDLFVVDAKTPAQKHAANLADFFENGPGLRSNRSTWIVAKNTPKKMVLKGGLGAMGVGQMWMTATSSDQDSVEYAVAPEVTFWTRRDLARAAWEMAGAEASDFDTWCDSRIKVLVWDCWQTPPLILAIAAWNAAQGRDSLAAMPPEDGAAFEQWYQETAFELIDEERLPRKTVLQLVP